MLITLGETAYGVSMNMRNNLLFIELGSISMLWWVFLVAQTVKNQPAMQETWVQSLSQEDPLEKVMATHSNILAWRIPQTEPGRLQSMGSQGVRHN